MSCMAISMEALAGVRETLVSSYFWKEQSDERPLGLHRAFTGCYGNNLKLTEIQAQEFVENAFVFNSIEYFKGEHAKSNAEPIEWGDFIRCLKNFNHHRLPIMQFYKTLRMIDYNTDAEGWMEKSVYENWSRREEYENFKKTIKRVEQCLAEFIISRTKEYQEAEWCY